MRHKGRIALAPCNTVLEECFRHSALKVVLVLKFTAYFKRHPPPPHKGPTRHLFGPQPRLPGSGSPFRPSPYVDRCVLCGPIEFRPG